MAKRKASLFRKNFAITFSVRMFSLFMQVFRSIIAARALGPGGRGNLSIIYTTAQTLLRLVESGISLSNVYFIGKKKYTRGEIFTNSLISAILFGGGAAGLFFVWLHFNPTTLGYVPHYYFYIAISMLPLALFAQYNTTIFQGMNQIITFNILKTLEPLTFFIMFVVLVEFVRLGVAGAVYADAIAVVVYVFVTVIVVLRLRGFKIKFNRKLFADAFSFGIRGHIGNIGGFLCNRFDVFLVNFYTDIEYVGLYAISAVVAESLMYIPNSLSPVLFPIVASEAKNNVHIFTAVICRNIFLITIVGGGALLLISRPLIIIAFGAEFAEAIVAAQILIPGMVALSMTRIIGSYFIGIGRPTVPSVISWVMLFINIPVNILLIPKWGIAGAALASTFSYGLGMLLSVFIFAEIGGLKLREILVIQRADLDYYHDFLMRLLEKTSKKFK